MAKHMFAGASSPIGFIDFFEHIMPLEKAKERYFLKGSSGSGKSTFIKKIAASFESKGGIIEKFHCANDTDSLDAISVNNLGLCIIDATAPHSHDPEIPVAVDKIIDFACFLDEKKIAVHADEIKSLILTKKKLAKKAQAYFGALGNVYLAEKSANEAALKMDCLVEIVQKYLEIFDFNGLQNRCGDDRKLFLSAVTPDGFVSFAENFFNGCKVYGICSCERIGADIFLSNLKDGFNLQGINTESFHCPFAPERLEYLYLPESKAAFAIIGGKFGYAGRVCEKIDISSCIDNQMLSYIKLNIEQNNELFDKVLSATVDSMKKSRDMHIRLEEIYAGAMDFGAVDEMTGRMIWKICYRE